jgi:Domain of unknown function (DUF5071)
VINRKLIEDLVPTHKLDLERAQAAVAAGYPRVVPILDDLLMCIQDVNWPVARVLLPFLAGLGSPLVPHVRRILSSEDHVWKYNVIAFVIAECETLRREFEPELCRLVASPTEVEKIEELPIVAADALGRLEA